MSGAFSILGDAEQEEDNPMVVFFMFEEGGAWGWQRESTPAWKHEKRAQRAHFRCCRAGVGAGRCQTHQTCPKGRVQCVQCEGWDEEDAEHDKHALVGVFVGFGMSETPKMQLFVMFWVLEWKGPH